MSKPGIVLPRFYSTDIINGVRVDEHARTLADALNGGLTVQNLAPTARFAASAFAEGRTIFTMTNTLDTGSVTPIGTGGVSLSVGVLPVAARLLGAGGWVGLVTTGGTSSATITLGFTVNNNGTNGTPLLYFNKTTTATSVKRGNATLGASAGAIFSLEAPAYQQTDSPAGTMFVGVLNLANAALTISYTKICITLTFSAAFST